MPLNDVISRIPGLAGYEAMDQINRGKEREGMSQQIQALNLMDVLSKRKKQQEAEQMAQQFASQFGNDPNMQMYARMNPSGFAEMMVKRKMERDMLAEEDARIKGMAPQTMPVVKQQPTMNRIDDPQAELASITDPAQREALMKAMAADKANVPGSFTAEPAQTAPQMIGGMTEEQALALAESRDKFRAAKGKMISNEFSKQRAAKEAAQSRRDLMEFGATLRPAPNSPAPTIKDIIDPKDSTRMISVDARTYKGGSLGDTGVLGIAGKEPTAAKKEEQVGSGRETVSSLTTTLRDYYDQLQKSGGITDPEQGALSNLGAGIASSGAGQFTGRLFGTQNQSIRNMIAQQRPLLLNAIKQATGMSAKQMDSNAELKLYLSAATDPTLDVAANKAALDKIDELYGLSGKTKKMTESQNLGNDNPVKEWSDANYMYRQLSSGEIQRRKK